MHKLKDISSVRANRDLISGMFVGKTVKSVEVTPEWGDDFDLKLTLEDGSVIRIFGNNYFDTGLSLDYEQEEKVGETSPFIPQEHHQQHS